MQTSSVTDDWLVPRSLAKLRRLSAILWNKKEELQDSLFKEVQIDVPYYDHRQPEVVVKKSKHAVMLLSLKEVNALYQRKTGGKVLSGLLPCGADSLFVRPAYSELYESLEQSEQSRKGAALTVLDDSEFADKVQGLSLKDIDQHDFIEVSDNGSRWDEDKAVIICGHPGIGKTYFISYMLVRRLLGGKTTILQLNTTDDEAAIKAQYFLFSNDGVTRLTPDMDLDDISRDTSIVALADQSPQGLLRRFREHEWLVIVTSSPRKENYYFMQKLLGTNTWYFGPWEWSELVATAILLNGMPQDKLSTLHELYCKYGPVARILLHILMPRSTGYNLNRIRLKVENYELGLERMMKDLVRVGPAAYDTHLFGNNQSHALLLMEINALPGLHYGTSSFLHIVTPYVGHRLGEMCCGVIDHSGHSLFSFCFGTAKARETAHRG